MGKNLGVGVSNSAEGLGLLKVCIYSPGRVPGVDDFIFKTFYFTADCNQFLVKFYKTKSSKTFFEFLNF